MRPSTSIEAAEALVDPSRRWKRTFQTINRNRALDGPVRAAGGRGALRRPPPESLPGPDWRSVVTGRAEGEQSTDSVVLRRCPVAKLIA